MSDDDRSSGELGRNIDALRKDMVSRFNAVDDGLRERVPLAVHVAHLETIEHRLDVLREAIGDVRRDQDRSDQIARNSRQFAIMSGLAALGVLVAVITMLRGDTDPVSGAMLADAVRMVREAL